MIARKDFAILLVNKGPREIPQFNRKFLIALRNFLSAELTSEALVMLVATELSVGDIADEATSEGLAVMLL